MDLEIIANVIEGMIMSISGEELRFLLAIDALHGSSQLFPRQF